MKRESPEKKTATFKKTDEEPVKYRVCYDPSIKPVIPDLRNKADPRNKGESDSGETGKPSPIRLVFDQYVITKVFLDAVQKSPGEDQAVIGIIEAANSTGHLILLEVSKEQIGEFRVGKEIDLSYRYDTR